MILFGILLLAASVPRPFTEERDLLDRRLLAVRRALPDGAHAPADVTYLKTLADAARLRTTALTPRAPTETGNRGEIVIDFTGFGRFTHIETFFRNLVASPRLMDVVSVALSATPEDTIRMTAAVRMPYWPVQARLPAAPEGTTERARGAAKIEVERFSRDQALLVAKTEALEELRRTRRNPRLFLAELAASTQDRPVVLNEVSWGDELFVVRGLTMGEGPTRGLERRLERGYFRLSEFLLARQAGCRRFEARGRCPIAGPDVELPVARDDPFRQDEAPCRIERDGPEVKSLHAAGARVKTAPGPLTIRAHEIDAADLFLMLHEITGQAFLVDEDVRPRLNVDFVGMTFDEIVAALAKAQIYVSPTAAIRRVSLNPAVARAPARPAERPPGKPAAKPATPTPAVTDEDDEDEDENSAETTAAPAATGSATPATAPREADVRLRLSLKRASVREVLGAIAQADPATPVMAPPGTLGRLSVWARDVDLRTLRAAVLEAAALQSETTEGRRTIFRTTPADATTPIEPLPPLRRLALRPADLSPDEFELVGVAGGYGEWRAFAYSPAGTLHGYRAGDVLADGALKTIDSTAVALEGEDGPLWVHLPAAP